MRESTAVARALKQPKIDPRVARSRAAILAAATTAFLREGYTATTMDMIAAEAGVSKRTVYNIFQDKDALFREVTLAAAGIAEGFVAEMEAALENPTDLEATLYALARRLTESATDPRVVRLRRLVIAEAHRFPDLAAEYYRRAPDRVIKTLAKSFESLAAPGRLKLTDSRRAAEHFAFLVLGSALDRAMFRTDDRRPSSKSLARAAEDGVRAFLVAYGD